MPSIIFQIDKKTGAKYAFESISYWDKDKKQPRSKRKYAHWWSRIEMYDGVWDRQELLSRINKDYSNSSKSSSMSPNHETIHNSREKSGLSPGGQTGHIHHGRKRKEPTEIREIPAPDKYLEDPDFQPTGKIIRKQLIKAHITTEVIE